MWRCLLPLKLLWNNDYGPGLMSWYTKENNQSCNLRGPKRQANSYPLLSLGGKKLFRLFPMCLTSRPPTISQYHLLQGWGFLEDVTLGVLLYDDLWIEIYLADGTEILPPPFIWAKHQWEGCFSAYIPLVLIAKCLEEGKRRPIFTLWLRYKVDRTMAQLRCCTAPELLCSHLYKSDAIDIERIDTSIREKHAKQLVFFFCFCPPLAFFHSMPGSRQKEGISFHCLIYALRTYISFWYFSLAKTHPAWNQNDDQHHGRQPPHVSVC